MICMLTNNGFGLGKQNCDRNDLGRIYLISLVSNYCLFIMLQSGFFFYFNKYATAYCFHVMQVVSQLSSQRGAKWVESI